MRKSEYEIKDKGWVTPTVVAIVGENKKESAETARDNQLYIHTYIKDAKMC